jgi:hypothetical protein
VRGTRHGGVGANWELDRGAFAYGERIVFATLLGVLGGLAVPRPGPPEGGRYKFKGKCKGKRKGKVKGKRKGKRNGKFKGKGKFNGIELWRGTVTALAGFALQAKSKVKVKVKVKGAHLKVAATNAKRCGGGLS